MKTVAYKLLPDLLISVHGKAPVSDEQFPEILRIFRGLDYENIRMLVVTEGGGPTPRQRSVMTKALGGRQMRNAVVSDDMLIRGIVTALSWFNPKIRSFRSDDLEGAMRYLGLPPARFDEVRDEVAVLQALLREHLGDPGPP
jgi:hypothetical protein